MENTSAPIRPPVSDEIYISLDVKQTKIRRRRRKALTGLIILTVLLCGLGLYYYAQHHSRVIFKVDGKKYTQKQVKSLAAYPKNFRHLSYETASKNIYELLEYRAAAEATGIKFTDNQLKDYRKRQGLALFQQKNYENYLNLVAYKSDSEQYMAQKSTQSKNGEYSGYSYIFHFDETLANGRRYKSPYFGDQARYQSDRAYAKSKADFYHAALSQHKIKPDVALAEIKADRQLGYYYVPVTNDSAKFGDGPINNWPTVVFYPPVIDFIKKQNKPGLSAIQMGKVPTTSGPPNKIQYAEGFYYFVLLTKAQKGIGDPQNALLRNLDAVTSRSKYYGGLHD